QSSRRAITLPVRRASHFGVRHLQRPQAFADEGIDAAALRRLRPAEEPMLACVVVAFGRTDAARAAVLEAAPTARIRRQRTTAAAAQARSASGACRPRGSCTAVHFSVHDVTSAPVLPHIPLEQSKNILYIAWRSQRAFGIGSTVRGAFDVCSIVLLSC